MPVSEELPLFKLALIAVELAHETSEPGVQSRRGVRGALQGQRRGEPRRHIIRRSGLGVPGETVTVAAKMGDGLSRWRSPTGADRECRGWTLSAGMRKAVVGFSLSRASRFGGGRRRSGRDLCQLDPRWSGPGSRPVPQVSRLSAQTGLRPCPGEGRRRPSWICQPVAHARPAGGS